MNQKVSSKTDTYTSVLRLNNLKMRLDMAVKYTLGWCDDCGHKWKHPVMEDLYECPKCGSENCDIDELFE